MKRIIIVAIATLVIGACTKEETPTPAPANTDQSSGSKAIYNGSHSDCSGAAPCGTCPACREQTRR